MRTGTQEGKEGIIFSRRGFPPVDCQQSCILSVSESVHKSRHAVVKLGPSNAKCVQMTEFYSMKVCYLFVWNFLIIFNSQKLVKRRWTRVLEAENISFLCWKVWFIVFYWKLFSCVVRDYVQCGISAVLSARFSPASRSRTGQLLWYVNSSQQLFIICYVWRVWKLDEFYCIKK